MCWRGRIVSSGDQCAFEFQNSNLKAKMQNSSSFRGPMNPKPAIRNSKYVLVAVLLLVLCYSAEAQQPKKVPHIGWIFGSSLSSSNTSRRMELFREGLGELGYIEGKNIIIEW